VLLTREDDRLLGSDERASLANNNKADLFVSLHVASSVQARAAGAAVFVLAADASPADAPAPDAPPVSMPVFGGGTRDVGVIPWNRAQAVHVDQSTMFARLVEAQMRAVGPMHPRPLEAAPLRVLVGANMPAVLVELGYLSNAADETRLLAPDAQARLAQALVDAIVRFDQAVRERAAGGGAR
jgi:N-acetylmuramoyl-L-alanine amidase